MESRHVTAGTLARLKRRLQRAGVRQQDVATEAGVTRTMVVHVLAGRTTSAPVLRTARRLIAEAKARRTQPDDGAAA